MSWGDERRADDRKIHTPEEHIEEQWLSAQETAKPTPEEIVLKTPGQIAFDGVIALGLITVEGDACLNWDDDAGEQLDKYLQDLAKVGP